jgi:GNAT superfamily N-acetyltransferase
MPAPLIKRGPELTEAQLQQLREIFFESSARKDFKDAAEREAFWHKYVGFYLANFPQYVLLAQEGEKVLGYVLGMPFSKHPELYEIQPHMALAEQYFYDYPAHLHINLHADARGKGIGSKLLKEFEEYLQTARITGLHIMTGTDSRNKNFYPRLGFDFEVTFNFRGNPILLMGKRLKGN